MPRRYAILDVFTVTPLEGNPLAVVLDADGLDGAAMQKIATEFNLSETVFVRPPEHAPHSAAIRIFTPREELPFACEREQLRILRAAARQPHDVLVVDEHAMLGRRPVGLAHVNVKRDPPGVAHPAI